jgi:hypothetical protein
MGKINQLNVFQDAKVQTELENIYRGFSQIGFGTLINERAENLDAYVVELTGASGAEISAAHDLKRVPFGFFCIGKNVSGDIWDGGTANTEERIYLRVGAGGVYKIIVI